VLAPARLGTLILILGCIGLVRLLPEVLQVSRSTRDYAAFVTMDAALALVTAASGEGLRHDKSWAPKLALRAAGVGLAMSIGMGAFIVSFMAEHGTFRDPLLVSRMLYYVLAVAFWPYGVRTLLRSAPEDSRKSLTISFILWLVFGAPLVVAVVAVFR